MSTVWHGDDRPFDGAGNLNATIADDYLKDNMFLTSGSRDYFEGSEYKQIAYASNPDPDTPIETMDFMTAPMLAFVEIKVTSLLKGEKSLPKVHRGRDRFINNYNMIMRHIKYVQSVYVKVKDPFLPALGVGQTPTPLGSQASVQGTPYTSGRDIASGR
ncbi:hypothetical protein WJX77_008699 [Trebouxia sp. C0004]